MREKAVQFLHKDPTIWGVISLLCTVAIGVKTAIPFDLLFIAVTGFFLCARLHQRGAVYALLILGVAASIKHAFLVSDHLWQLGIEGSLACAFLMTAWAFEQGAHWIATLESQMQIRQSSVANLEEELAKMQETAQEHQITFQEKVALLQKELEDLQTEHSSILILNEVLRKTTAKHVQENEMLNLKVKDLYCDRDLLREEIEECQKDLARLSDEGSLAAQNSELMQELNAARSEQEQTHLINETLARLYAREHLRAKDADQEAASLADQLIAAKKQVEKVSLPFEEKLAAAQNEIQSLSFQFEKANAEANQARSQLLQFNELAAERSFLKERLRAAMEEISLLQEQKKGAPDPELNAEMAQQLAFAQEKVFQLAQIEPIFKQLKKQFEEKNKVLHETRKELFVTDTELQKLRLEKAAYELNPLPKEVEEELHRLSSQLIDLEAENQELQELITILNEASSDPVSDAAKRKKKVKMNCPPEQEFLF